MPDASVAGRSTPRGPSIALQPQRLWQRALFAAHGRRLLSNSLRRLAQAPQQLNAEQRAQLQRGVGKTLLDHLRVRLDIGGLQHVPRPSEGAHIIVSLHEGLADALCLTQLPLAMRFVARQEIFEWDDIGPAIARMRHIAIEPEQGAASYRKLLREAGTTLRTGEHVLLFPQGCLLGIEIAFAPGAFRLARSLNAPILPIVITGAHRIWEHPFSPTLRYGQRVSIRILPPIPALEAQRLGCDRLRLELQRRMKAIALSSDCVPPRRYVPQRDGLWEGFAFSIDPDFASTSIRGSYAACGAACAA